MLDGYLTWGSYLWGLAHVVAGYLVGLATPRIWRFMHTTFGGA